MAKDYYEILGVAKDATEEEISAAYKKKAMLYHPDRQQGKTDAEKKEAEEKFKECAEAAEVLKDPEKRRRYDQFGTADGQEFGGFGGSGGFDPMEFFRRMHPGFGFDGGFNGFGFDFGGGERDSPPDIDSPEDGEDVQVRANISFEESVSGCVKEFDVTLDKECRSCHGAGAKDGARPRKCKACGGTGRHAEIRRSGIMVQQIVTPCRECGGSGYSYDKCPTCGGSGTEPEKRHVKVKVPAGFQDGQRLRLRGLGRCGKRGGRHGDLYVVVSVEESKTFIRNGNNVGVKVPISPAIASLGGKIEVPTPYGPKKVKVEPGTASGTKMRIAGGGIKPETGAAGDLVVFLEIEPYVNLTDEQKDLLERLRATERPSNFRR